MNRNGGDPSIARICFAFCSSLVMSLASVVFGLLAVAPQARGWLAVLLLIVAICSFTGGVKLAGMGIQDRRSGRPAPETKPWVGFLSGSGAILGVVLASSVSKIPAYWILSTGFFAMICGGAIRVIPYLREQSAEQVPRRSDKPEDEHPL